MEMGKYKKFMEMFTKLQVSNPFCESLEKMLVYANFMKEILTRKLKLKYYENIALTKECSTII